MKKEKIILVGSGGHAGIVLDIIKESGQYEVIGVTTKNQPEGDFFKGVRVLGDDSVLPDYLKKGITKVAIGIGGFTDNKLRKKLFLRMKELGFTVVSSVHPGSIISKSAVLGEGVCIFAGVVINCDVKIGNNVVIATSSSVDHETIINDHVLVSAGVTIGAYATIHEGSLLALGAKITSGIIIGNDSLVAAGAVVVKNVAPDSKVYGIPARCK